MRHRTLIGRAGGCEGVKRRKSRYVARSIVPSFGDVRQVGKDVVSESEHCERSHKLTTSLLLSSTTTHATAPRAQVAARASTSGRTRCSLYMQSTAMTRSVSAASGAAYACPLLAARSRAADTSAQSSGTTVAFFCPALLFRSTFRPTSRVFSARSVETYVPHIGARRALSTPVPAPNSSTRADDRAELLSSG